MGWIASWERGSRRSMASTASRSSFSSQPESYSSREERARWTLSRSPPFSLLDLGCGPGRDLSYFSSIGHEAVGLDGCARFCEMARRHSGCEVLHQDFLNLSLEPMRYDGIFANASLFHVPSQELHRVLGELRDSLKTRGVLFSSNPHGHNEEGWSAGRYSCFYDLPTWRGQLDAAGFVELAHYYRPEGKPRHEQPWLATVWRRR